MSTAMPSDADIDDALDAMECDSTLRRMWLDGQRGEDIRAAISGSAGLSIGVIGHRVQTLGLPVRDGKLQILQHGVGDEVHFRWTKDAVGAVAKTTEPSEREL